MCATKRVHPANLTSNDNMRIVASIIGIYLLYSIANAVEVNPNVFETASLCLGDVPVEVIVNTPNYCIVGNLSGQGFAIFARCINGGMKIIGYSTTGTWNVDSIPAAILQWLERIDQIAPLTDRTRIDTDTRIDVEPLLTCHWHQQSPYNDLAPVIEDGNIKCVAGCVAIAASQITYYWRKDNPKFTLEDTPTYPYGGAPVTMSIPAGSPNNWELMRDEYTDEDCPESRAAVAQLCYVIGTTSYLNYASSTGGHIDNAANAMYSQYNLLSDYYNKSSFTQEQWDSLLYHEVLQRRPVMCSGQGSGGHAFVLDGYDRTTGLFHFNFGWGGNGDGYYAIDDSEDAMGGYYLSQSVACNIRPKNRNVIALMTAKYIGKSIGMAEIRITNNSTLPITQLSVYAIESSKELDENSIPVWQSNDVIDNDTVTHKITIPQFPLPQSDNSILYLTDENGDILASCNMESSGLTTIYVDEVTDDMIIYNLTGVKVDYPQPNTIYIIRKGTTTKKIILK